MACVHFSRSQQQRHCRWSPRLGTTGCLLGSYFCLSWRPVDPRQGLQLGGPTRLPLGEWLSFRQKMEALHPLIKINSCQLQLHSTISTLLLHIMEHCQDVDYFVASITTPVKAVECRSRCTHNGEPCLQSELCDQLTSDKVCSRRTSSSIE